MFKKKKRVQVSHVICSATAMKKYLSKTFAFNELDFMFWYSQNRSHTERWVKGEYVSMVIAIYPYEI